MHFIFICSDQFDGTTEKMENTNRKILIISIFFYKI